MKKISRPILLIGVALLIFLNSACNLQVPTVSAPAGTILPNGQTPSSVATPTALIPVTETSTPSTPVIPITGENVVQMQCQFCVNGLAHAVFIFPDFAIFDVETTTPVTCLTAEVVNGKRVLVCNGTQLTSFNLKICSDSSNCLLFPVALQACPLSGTGTPFTTVTPLTPVFLTPINTLRSPTRTPEPGTPIASQAPPPATSTTAPTTYP